MRATRLILTIFCAAAVLCLPACVIPQTTVAIALQPTPDSDLDRDPVWPSRWGPGDTKGAIGTVEGGLDRLRPAHLGRHHVLRPPESVRPLVASLAAGEPGITGYSIRAEGGGSFVYVEPLPSGPSGKEDDAPKTPGPEDPTNVFYFLSVQGSPDEARIERTWFALYEARLAPEQPPRGTLILLPGMLGTPEPVIEGVVRSFRRRGWFVLRMMAPPARFTERVVFAATVGDADYGSAPIIAEELSDRVAEAAYATEAALRHARTLRPAMKMGPTLLMGMSGGAMALPTVHAWSPDEYDGAVMIAGGADFLTINTRSNYAEWIDAIELAWEGDPTEEDTAGLTRAYLEHSSLDSYHTARTLVGKPTLMLHASRDKAVPSPQGDLLWARLGEPERWSFPVGHELIFLGLPLQLERLHEWADEHLPPPSPPGSASP